MSKDFSEPGVEMGEERMRNAAEFEQDFGSGRDIESTRQHGRTALNPEHS